MDKNQLKSLRKLLFIDVKEAAACIGGVSVRTWQYWESGVFKIPADVQSKIIELVKIRQQLIKNPFSEFENNEIQGKIIESAKAHILAESLNTI